MFKAKIDNENIADVSYELSKEIIDFYGVEDFRETIPRLVELGFDGWFTLGSIVSETYNDIAIFDNSDFDIIEAKIHINGEWSDYKPLDEIETIYTEWYENQG